MDTFKGEYNGTLKQLCSKINLTNKFQPLDISITKAEKKSNLTIGL